MSRPHAWVDWSVPDPVASGDPGSRPNERGSRDPAGRSPGHRRPPTADRRPILARTRLGFWLDALLLVAYTLTYSLGFTGVATYEWLGMGLGVVLLVHLTLHRDWVICIRESA
jgi:hypothetical protein